MLEPFCAAGFWILCTPRMHRLIFNLYSFNPERDGHSNNALFMFVADLDNDDMVRGIQRHLLGDFASKVHGMAFGTHQVLEFLPGMIRPKSQSFADVEVVTRHGCL